jgi:hypothetical protein
MGTSAKRHGISVDDPELESRLRKTEQALEKKQDANYIAESGSQRRARAELPAVTGVTIDDSVLGTNSIIWDSLDINIYRYEVQIDTEAGFATPDTFKVTEPQMVLPATLDPSLTYYARIRGVGTRVKQGFHEVGDWSSTLTFTPGQGSYTNLQTGAAGNVIKYEFTDTAFDVLLVTSAPGVTDYDQQILDVPQFELPTSATCLFIVMHQYLWGEDEAATGSSGIQRSDSIKFRLYLDGQSLFTFNKRFKDAAITKWDRWQDTVTLVGPPQILESGVHKLKYRIEQSRDTTASNGNDCFLTTQNLVISVLEVRR